MLSKRWTREASRPIESALCGLSALRGARIFHPEGRAFEALLTVERELPELAGTALGRRASMPALARLSRAFALPRALGDIHGVAFRIGDPRRREPADVLLAGSLDGALGKWVPAFRRATTGPLTVSSLLPFRNLATRRLLLLGAWLVPPPGSTFEALLDAGLTPAALVLWVAAPLAPPRRFGSLELSATAASPAFEPGRPPRGLAPAGAINRLRPPAYRGSRRGRSRAG